MNPQILEQMKKYLPEMGVFIEVGAYDGISHSLTWGLAEKGWKGYCFEPVGAYYLRAKQNHEKHDVMVFNTAIGDGSEIELAINAELTSSKEYVYEVAKNNPEWINHFVSPGYIRVPTVRLNSIKTIKPDFISIDVEGMEWEVLQYSPEAPVIAIELHKGSPYWQQEEALQMVRNCEQWMEEKGYKCVYFDDINSLFVKQ